MTGGEGDSRFGGVDDTIGLGTPEFLPGKRPPNGSELEGVLLLRARLTHHRAEDSLRDPVDRREWLLRIEHLA
jgi:hypothetical protein